MKFILVLAALACTASAAPQTELGRQIVERMLAKLLPALDPEIPLNKTEIVLENSLSSGVVSLDNGLVSHLDQLTDDLVLNLIFLTIKGTVTVPLVRLTGDYTADVLLFLSIGEQKVLGAGAIDASATGVTLSINADLGLNLITQILSVKKLDFLPKITSANIVCDGATANGEPIDWEAVSADLAAFIDKYFVDHGAEFNVEVLEAVNNVLATHTLAEWLAIIGQSGAKLIE